MRRLGSRPLWAFAGSGLFAVALPVLESTAICDFEVVAQAFTLGALLVFEDDLARTERSRAARLGAQCAIAALALVGTATKASAGIIPFVLLARLLMDRPSPIRRYLGLLAVLGLLVVAPHLGGGGSDLRWSAGLVRDFGLKLATVAGWPLLGLGVGATLKALVRRAPGGSVTSRPTLAVAWLLANIALLGFLPASDNRYLVGTLASFTALAVLGLQDVTGRLAPARRTPAIALLGLLAAGQVTYNAYLAVHFRGFWGSQFIAANRLVDFVEGRFEGAVVVYPYWRELLYAPEPRNRYVLFREAELTAAGATLQPTESGTVLSFEGSPSIVFLASMVPDPSLPTVARLLGQADSLFDRWASWTDLRPRTMLESPYLGEPVAFPTTYHLYDLSSTPSM